MRFRWHRAFRLRSAKPRYPPSRSCGAVSPKFAGCRRTTADGETAPEPWRRRAALSRRWLVPGLESWATYALSVALLAGQMTFTNIAKGDASGQQTRRQVIVRTPAEWQALWKEHSPEAKIPDVDFNSKMVVGIFLGSKPTTGYAVEIVGVRTQAEDLVVEYVERQPGRGMITAQMLTEPFQLVAVAKHPGAVRFLHVPQVPAR
jgi:protease stability complex PrcB-like protein